LTGFYIFFFFSSYLTSVTSLAMYSICDMNNNAVLYLTHKDFPNIPYEL